MTNQIEDKRIRIVLDATLLDTFLSCPQKFYLRHKLNKVTPILARPLDRGQLLHTGMENYFSAVAQGNKFESALECGLNSIGVAALDSDLTAEEIENVKFIVRESCIVNRDADYRYEILAVEHSFAYTLYEDDDIVIIMIGKIDLLVNDGHYQMMPIDHKSYERDFPVHRKTNQFCNYAYFTKSNWLLVNRVGFQKSITPEKKHKRLLLSYDEQFLEQWKNNVVKWCHFYLECEATNSFPLNDTSCDKFNRLCEYYSICDASGEDTKIYKLNTQFKDGQSWDVSAILGNK